MWEYRLIEFTAEDYPELRNRLNELGRERWELAAIADYQKDLPVLWVFKRKLEE